MEAFISIHMSLFVLMPLSKIISKENSKRIFWILFVIWIAILLFFDLFITKGIAIIDFILVFIGAFIIIPIASIKDKEGVVNDVPINNNEEQENIETFGDLVNYVEEHFNGSYNNPEVIFLKVQRIISEQLNISISQIYLHSNLKRDLGMDSLDVFETAMAIEEEFAIEIPDEYIERIKIVEDYILPVGWIKIKHL